MKNGKAPSWLEFRLADARERRRRMAAWLDWHVRRQCPECKRPRRLADPLGPTAHRMDCDFPSRMRSRGRQ